MSKNPGNETPEHYELKQIAKYILWKWGCRCIGTEVDGCYGNPAFGTVSKKGLRSIIDTVGLKMDYRVYSPTENPIRVYGFEAKASLADFLAGFCTACEYTYIIAPAGVIPAAKLPPAVGLVEVDLQHYEIRQHINTGYEFRGVHTARRARRNIRNGFYGASEKQYQGWAVEMLRQICKKQSADDVFRRPAIKIQKYLRNGRMTAEDESVYHTNREE